MRFGNAQERAMDRIRVLEESLWPKVPREVIEEAALQRSQIVGFWREGV